LRTAVEGALLKKKERTLMESEYSKKLKDVRWQKMRLTVFERDDWTCRAWLCGRKEGREHYTLQAHHRYYRRGAEPWDYAQESIITMCEECHQKETAERWKAEQNLLKQLREKGLLAGDLGWFASHLETDETIEDPSSLMFAFGWILGDRNLQRLVLDLVHAQL